MSYYDFPFTIRDICDLEGIRLPNDGRQNHTAVCPACGKHTLSISTGKNNFNCFSCGVHGGMLQLYILCKGESLSLSESRREIMERLGLDEQDEESNYQKRIKEIREKNKQDEVPQSSLRSELELDETYEELLNMLSLSKDHFDNLIERGLSEDYIKIRKYRSYPISSYQEFPRKIMEQGHYVDGVPGFYKDSKGNWNLKTLKRGIMIPIINLNNQICGFQIRKDNALLKEWVKKDSNGHPLLDEEGHPIIEKEKKFTWLSSRGQKEGVGVAGSIHYACDFVSQDGLFVPKRPDDDGIVLTEGPLKADIFYNITGYPAMAVPGVSCQVQLGSELDKLKGLGFKKVYNAYDMDYLTNENVFNAMENSYKMIQGKGFELVRLVWNAKDKGLDDYYANKYRK